MEPSLPSNFDRYKLGETADKLDIDTSHALRTVTIQMVSQARTSIDIISRSLDPVLYDNREFLATVRGFLLASQHARLRIIVQKPEQLISHGHRLLELAQRFSSFVDIRTPAEEHAQYNKAILLVDRVGYVSRRFADRYEADVEFNNRLRVKELGGLFDDMWEVAHPEPHLRHLHL